MGLRNRMATSKNLYQGSIKKILCCCSAGLLRSPTAAVVLASEPFSHNTRACGVTQEYALIPFEEVLAFWADEIVCMEKEHEYHIQVALKNWNLERSVICLEIPDNFPYRHPELIQLITEKYKKLTEGKDENRSDSL